MRHSNLLLLLMGAIFLLFSCSKDDSIVEPDQEPSVYKAKEITDFTGLCTPLLPPPEGGNYWLDDATDERVSGITLWHIEGTDVGKFWGTAEFFVGAEEIGGDYDGKWEMKWYGTQTVVSDVELIIVALAVGTGTEGNVKGMFAEWTYTMNTLDGFYYNIEGYLASKQLATTLKINDASGPFEVQPPGHADNDCGGDLFRLFISGGGNCSHLGNFAVTNEVCFYFDTEMNIVPMSDWLGCMTAANGDKIFTQMIYSWDMNGMSYFLYDILDGTGKFAGASGYVETYGTDEFDPYNPLIGTWNLDGMGVVVH